MARVSVLGWWNMKSAIIWECVSLNCLVVFFCGSLCPVVRHVYNDATADWWSSLAEDLQRAVEEMELLVWLQHQLGRCSAVDFDCGISLAVWSGHGHGINSRLGPALCQQHLGSHICPGTVMPSAVYSTLYLKNNPNIFSCNSRKHSRISIMFWHIYRESKQSVDAIVSHHT